MSKLKNSNENITELYLSILYLIDTFKNICRELINPSEVVVNSSHEVLLAQPVVTPIEQLRRKDKEVARALEEKQKLIEEILNIPHEELDTIAAEVESTLTFPLRLKTYCLRVGFSDKRRLRRPAEDSS